MQRQLPLNTYRHDQQRRHIEESKVDHIEHFRVVQPPIRDAYRFAARPTPLIGHRVHVHELGQRVNGGRYPHANDDQLEWIGKGSVIIIHFCAIGISSMEKFLVVSISATNYEKQTSEELIVKGC